MSRRRSKRRSVLWLALPILLCSDAQAQQAPATIAARIEMVRSARVTRLGGDLLLARSILPLVYARHGYAPFWSTTERRDALLRSLEDVAADGLRPRDYHYDALRRLLTSMDPADRTDADILASDAVLRLATDLRFGRIDPATIKLRAASESVAAVLTAPDLQRALRELRPQHYTYAGLRSALQQLQTIERNGGWDTLMAPTTRLETATAGQVLRLRQRLYAEEYPVEPGNPAMDSTLVRAIKLFQHRHGLNEDGIAGPATTRAMNVAVRRRIEQVRLNLERARWITPSIPSTFVAVNIAGAKLYYVRNGIVVTEMRVIVGRTYTRTPVFDGRITTIELNPEWVVPPGIVHEIVEAARRDPTYLERNRIRYTGGRYVQAPGPLNPLGRIKFIFPNRFNVYLHDTPGREKFNDEVRLFSHGCIRIQDPLGLAELLLADRPEWSAERLRSAVASGARKRISLTTPVTVSVMYWTASTDLHGELHYYSDVYGRDVQLLRTLGQSEKDIARINSVQLPNPEGRYWHIQS